MTITTLQTETKAKAAVTTAIVSPVSSPAKAAWGSLIPISFLQLQINLTFLLQQTFYHLLVILLQQRTGLRLRWRKFKDALFYEMMLLLLQPNPVMLILMWPGWIVVLAVVVWRWWAGAGDVV
ncbi:hypothetical protein L873DRAFT_1817925 [Choiromyces venosus 120613-1]|uniref:Uncharacterized protein n=1 Tax=Choiromyces venosus 120613-1 TaxID=1336337 RepID=A0A3N4J298_9PEZI|nr:hypothetical protein L873DRAFT_1817925 [Choiromyces venosus 120613-1]